MRKGLEVWFRFSALAAASFVVVGCNTNHPQVPRPVEPVAHNQVHGDVLTLAVHTTARTSMPPQQNAFRSKLSGLLTSSYGAIHASTTARTRSPLIVTLVHQGKRRVVYDDRSKLVKQLLGWQVAGRYLLLNIGSPDPDVAVADFPGEAVVVDLQTNKVVSTKLIGEESQITTLFVTPTDLVQQWYYDFGTSNVSDQYATELVNLKTGARVTMQSGSYFPLGTKLYPNGSMVYFAGRNGVYSVDIPGIAWTRSTSVKWYQVVLKPTVKFPVS